VDIAYSGQLRWPSSTPYFFDPLKITSYVGCPWHDFAHVKNYGAALGVVYRHATGSALTGAHDAIEDVKGQIEVCLKKDPTARDTCLMDHADKNKGIELLEDIFAAKRVAAAGTLRELKRPVPEGWIDEDTAIHKGPRQMQYNSGSSGGPQSGPSTEGAKHAMDPVALFLVFLPIAVLASIAEESNRYAQEIVKVSLYGHKLPVLCMDISDDNTLLVTGSADKNIKIWGLDFGDCHKSIFAHSDSIMSLGFVPGTHYFFSASKDKMIKYWDGDKFEQIHTVAGHHGEVR
jgi:hypothetical protein